MELTVTDIKQLALVEVLLKLFKDRFTNNTNSVKTGELLETLANSCKLTTNGASLRIAIGYIRHYDMLKPGFIVSDVNAGYWLTYDDSEMSDYIEKQLNRMSNQFQNVKLLHQRIRHAKTSPEIQPQLF